METLSQVEEEEFKFSLKFRVFDFFGELKRRGSQVQDQVTVIIRI